MVRAGLGRIGRTSPNTEGWKEAMDLLQTGARWLQGKQRRYVARTIVYRRGDDTVTLSATVGRTEFEQATDYGIALQSESRDYIVQAADLILGGRRVEPQVGDKVEEIIDGITHEYEVMSIGSEQCFTYCDSDTFALRIHTKRTGARR